MHGTIEQVFRVEWRPLAELAAIAAEWRALAARALEPNVFYDPAFALAAAPVFGHDVGRRAGLVARHAAGGCSDSSRRGSNGGATASAAGPRRLDASLCAARHTAGRSRCRRRGDRRLARSRGAGRSELAAPHAAAVHPDGRPLRRGLRRRCWRGAAAMAHPFAAHRARPAGARRRTRRAISTARSGRSARSCAGSAGGSSTSGVVRSAARAIRTPWSTRSATFSRSKRPAGRAAPAPRRATTPSFARSWNTPSPRSRARARRRSTGCSSNPRRSPPRSRCAAATPPGAGRSPTTRTSRALRPACSFCSM